MLGLFMWFMANVGSMSYLYQAGGALILTFFAFMLGVVMNNRNSNKVILKRGNAG
jgi:alkylglycerol monooxygenase